MQRFAEKTRQVAALCFGVVFGAALIWTAPANAVPVDSNTIAKLTFDFTAASAQPPYININFELLFGLDDDFAPGDVFTIQAFGPDGSSASNPITIHAVSPSGGELESGFGGPFGNFLGLATAQGYLELTGVSGSFDLSAGRVEAANGGGPQNATGWFDAVISTQRVSEPFSVALVAPFLVAFGLRKRARRTMGYFFLRFNHLASWQTGLAPHQSHAIFAVNRPNQPSE